jgi:hypothetical protein
MSAEIKLEAHRPAGETSGYIRDYVAKFYVAAKQHETGEYTKANYRGQYRLRPNLDS